MDEENRFWAYLWSLATLIVLVLVVLIFVTIFLNGYRRETLVREAITHGVNPVLATCAYDQPDRSGVASSCAQALARTK